MILFQLKGKTKIWGVSVIWNRLTLKKKIQRHSIKKIDLFIPNTKIFSKREGEKKIIEKLLLLFFSTNYQTQTCLPPTHKKMFT